jgi:two-component system sensor histidine kinase PilS (NtrC family)
MRTAPSPSAFVTRATFWRTLQTFGITRIVIMAVLMTYFGFSNVRSFEHVALSEDWKVAAVYLLFAVGFVGLSVYIQRGFFLQLLAQIGIDILAISLLYVSAGGARSGLAILYLFPLAGGAILAPLVGALFFASIVTLILLAEGGYQVLQAANEASLSSAGLSGAAFFAAVYVINRLAAKLIKQEALAVERGRRLQMQEAINRLVIADMGDGILVLGADGEIFARNPAATRMLGLPQAESWPYHLRDVPALQPIADAFSAWIARPESATASAFVTVKPVEEDSLAHGEWRRDLAAHLKLRFASVRTPDWTDDRTVLFLQDVTEIENRAQQLKLASMGRLTASIAHEVRNPLAAIAHANSLLREEVSDPVHARLLRIVGDNVVRLDRMVEDILKLSRRAQTQNEPLELEPFLAETLAEFRETHPIAPGMIVVSGVSGCRVRFDPLHLREVVVNLLSNALRYASGNPGSIRIRLLRVAPARLELHVQDDGPPITPEVRAHLFEPFYTTSSKGTGLGLYLARELCLNNGAMLDYEYRSEATGDASSGPTGRFVIAFAADPTA